MSLQLFNYYCYNIEYDPQMAGVEFWLELMNCQAKRSIGQAYPSYVESHFKTAPYMDFNLFVFMSFEVATVYYYGYLVQSVWQFGKCF